MRNSAILVKKGGNAASLNGNFLLLRKNVCSWLVVHEGVESVL